MNKDIFEGKWKQVRGEAKVWWGKLTDDDLDKVAGKFDVFVGLLQEKYGYSRENAEADIEKHLDEYEAEEAHASCDIVYTPPEWLEVHERDQMSAHLRDGAACILVIYMREGSDEEEEDIDFD